MQEIKKINLSLEWKYEKLGKLCSFDKEGVNPKEDIKYYHYSFPAFDNNKEPEVEVGKDIKSSKFLFNKGDILFNKLNVKFKRVWDIDFDIDENSICSTEFIPIQAKNIDRNFLYYCLISPNFTNEMKYLSTGTSNSHQRINPKDIKDYDLFLPTDEEIQKKIGYILKLLDKKISMNVEINKNLTICIDVNFKNNLLNFNQYSEQELVSSELGLIPKEWEVSNLTNIANYQNGLAMQKFPPENDADCFKVLKIKELRQGFFDETSDSCSKNIKEECIVYDGDVIFSWSGSLLVDIWTGGTCGLNQHLFKVTSSKFDKWFYYCWTKFYLDQFILIAKDKATTMGHIKRKHLDESLVLIPDKETYSKLTMLFKPLFDMLIKNKIEIKKLQNLRDVLMPKLMSGEVDVSKINCDLELKYNYMKYLFNQIHKQLSKSVV